MAIPEHTREELLYPGMNGIETSVTLAEEGNPFTGERYMRRETVKWVFEQLNASGIPYAIIGGLAVAHHATPRLTRDVDILALDEDRKKIHLLFAKYLVLKTETFTTFLFSGAKVDFFIAKLPHERQALLDAEDANLDEVPVKVVKPRDLILLKLHAAWERRIYPKASQDRTDIEFILHQSQDKLSAADIAYIAEGLRQRYTAPEELEGWKERIRWLNETLERLGLGDWRYPLD